jgi:hypothetical protein
MMIENEKDWSNPAFVLVYSALAKAYQAATDDGLRRWLNDNCFGNLTCCPECHVDDFRHVETCKLAAKISDSQLIALAKVAEQLRRRLWLTERMPQMSRQGDIHGRKCEKLRKIEVKGCAIRAYIYARNIGTKKK